MSGGKVDADVTQTPEFEFENSVPSSPPRFLLRCGAGLLLTNFHGKARLVHHYNSTCQLATCVMYASLFSSSCCSFESLRAVCIAWQLQLGSAAG